MNEYMKSRQEHISKGRPLPEKKKHTINKVSPKRQKKLDELKEAGTDSELDKWFEAKRKEMKGVCVFCGGKSEKHNDDNFRSSVAHLLPKRSVNTGGFPSVSTHPDNWIELCHYGNDCHGNFDRSNITWKFLRDSKEWEILSEKLHNILPEVAEEERKHKLYSRLTELLYDTTRI